MQFEDLGKAALRVTKNYAKSYSGAQAKGGVDTSNDSCGPSGNQMNETGQLTTMQDLGKAALRVTKNYAKRYSDTQAKVGEATSNDPWEPSDAQMNEIAQLTYNQNDFTEITEMLSKRLRDNWKNWRHVFKSLTVLDYCLRQGSENVFTYFRDNIYIIKILKDFQHVDEDGKDQGANVREKANDITSLLMDEVRLREERRLPTQTQDWTVYGANGEVDREKDEENSNNDLAGNPPDPDEEDLRRAIEESKRSQALVQDMTREEEQELQAALKASEEEDTRRKEERELQAALKVSEEEERTRKEVQELQAALMASDEAEMKRKEEQELLATGEEELEEGEDVSLTGALTLSNAVEFADLVLKGVEICQGVLEICENL
ncbi:hypothetical protein EST38_g5349 [Candolleomyces aberdarensis]|uniref:ENTH domain-containing protein n=1 Tax=Candolleomyces aberdarensis TaxID=2316362 RepID=A0A4Q2DMC1_9AGAR|nr:hypothetical protein EST38_g5349 [Candolleomyces aberdarensis]